jgi:hypothetical protein
MVPLTNPSQQRQTTDTAVVSLTTVQCALWQTGMPVLDANAVAEHKRCAKLGMLWHAVRWHLLGMAALVALMCLGRQWGRAAGVGAAAVLLATLFAWLVNIDLQWLAMRYSAYQDLHAVPEHVTAAANALLSRGVSIEQIGVEYLKNDPILFVEDADQSLRYDLIIW